MSAMSRFPAVGRSRLFGSPLTLGGFRPFFPGTGPLQRDAGFNRAGIAPLRFGLGPLSLGLGLSPGTSAVTAPGAVPTGRAAPRRRLTPEEEAAVLESLRRSGALPTAAAPPAGRQAVGGEEA